MKKEIISKKVQENVRFQLETRTEPKMNKRGNELYGRVTKHTAYINIWCGNYAQAVNTARLQEGKTADFAPNASQYERVNHCIVQKGEQEYVQFLFDEKSATTMPIWYVDGRPATKEEIEYIKSFLPKKSSNRQGLERENVVQVRVVKLENVVAITTDGETTTFEGWRA